MRSRMYASALALGVWASGCGDPELETDLDTEGPPEVTAVAVSSQSAGAEVATFCLQGEDYKVNKLLCPETDPGVRPAEPVTDAMPMGWTTRVVFSELLDASVEELVTDEEGNTFGTLANTQPVTLTCGGAEVAYDGYYDPSGNDVTIPAGPSLLVAATEFVATGTECTVAVKASVTDKDGNAVPESMRGPYDFAIAAMAVAGTLPADMEGVDDDATTGHAPGDPVQIAFNAPVDADTLAGNITLAQGGTPVAATLEVFAEDPSIVLVIPDAPLADDTVYTLTISGGIADVAGGPFAPEAPIEITFATATAEASTPDAGEADAATPDAGMADAGMADAAI